MKARERTSSNKLNAILLSILLFFAVSVENAYSAAEEHETLNLEYSSGDHWIYADLALSGDKLLVNDSDLFSYRINTDTGDVRWRFSILKAFHQEDGYRIFTDELAGGGYYQSKPTAVDGMVYIGTPSRFVYSMDADTRKEMLKFYAIE